MAVDLVIPIQKLLSSPHIFPGKKQAPGSAITKYGKQNQVLAIKKGYFPVTLFIILIQFNFSLLLPML